MNDFTIAGLAVIAFVIIVAAACVIVARVRARILRNEDAKATEAAVAAVATVLDAEAEARKSDETALREGMRRARLAYVHEPADVPPSTAADTRLGLGDAPTWVDPTETFNAESRETLSSVASNLVFVGVEPEFGRSYSDINPEAEAADPWLTDAEVYESGEIAKATIAAIYDAEVDIPERTSPWGSNSYNGFDPKREWARINAAIEDSVVADVLKKRDPMMAFLLPVNDDEPLPEFADSVAAWAPQHRLDPGHDIDGISISWHTGLTQAMRIIRQPAIESVERAR